MFCFLYVTSRSRTTAAPPLLAGRMALLWSFLREAIARLSRGVMRIEEFFWSICRATMMRTSERTSSGIAGWDKIDSMFPVLQRLEAKVFQTCTPKLWKRYVDDTFIILDTDKLSDFHIALNNASLESSSPWIRKRTVIYLFSTY